jgi:hypothetical protein
MVKSPAAMSAVPFNLLACANNIFKYIFIMWLWLCCTKWLYGFIDRFLLLLIIITLRHLARTHLPQPPVFVPYLARVTPRRGAKSERISCTAEMAHRPRRAGAQRSRADIQHTDCQQAASAACMRPAGSPQAGRMEVQPSRSPRTPAREPHHPRMARSGQARTAGSRAAMPI